MACDARTIPFTLGGDSVKLDLGRSRRLASPTQTLTLELLWATCSFADCQAPVDWSEMHHTIPYNEDGQYGPTDIGYLSPVCRGNCHDKAHTPGWQFFKDPDTHATTTIAPDGTTWKRVPNGPGIKDRSSEPPPAAATDASSEPEPAATLFNEAA
jgi:hypothetical protein